MRITLKITADVQRVRGKFVSREEIIQEMISQVESANPYTVSGIGADGESEYEIMEWEVEEA
jgi:hypothetical protein